VHRFANLVAVGSKEKKHSELPAPPAEIIAAMKLYAALHVERGILDAKVEEEICGTAQLLPLFLSEDEQMQLDAARLLMKSGDQKEQFIGMTKEMALLRGAHARGDQVYGELKEFIRAIEKLDPSAPCFHETAYELAGFQVGVVAKSRPVDPSLSKAEAVSNGSKKSAAVTVCWLMGLLLAAVVWSANSWGINREDHAAVIARAVTVLLIPFGLLLVPQIVRRSREGHWRWASYVPLFVILAVATAICIEVGARERSKQKPALHQRVSYSPEWADFGVSFSGKPKVRGYQGEGFRGEEAIWTEAGKHTFEKAEIVEMAPAVLAALNKESVIERLKLYVKTAGLQYPSYTWDVTASGPIAEVHASKVLIHNGKPIQVRYRCSMRWSKRMLVALYAGGPAETFPGEGSVEFFNSLRAK
jgi:hypothetical protein